MKFSLNLNKIALLRNARGDNYPNLDDYANIAIDLGVDGLTLHPRPDHRHATSSDVISIAKLCKDRGVEFNLEGNPFSEKSDVFLGFKNLVLESKPDQITLVPDLPNQITSDHGWESGDHDQALKALISDFKNISPTSKISLFVDHIKNGQPNLSIVEYAKLIDVDGIEIHTGAFSKCIDKGDLSIIESLSRLITITNTTNLFVNAGHDLNLRNLPELIKIGGINEVSIGHAVIIESLKNGFTETIKSYINLIKGKL